MNGIILVKKEKNMTSHDVVNHMRRILGTKKVGHSGTLDPSVEGVLAVFLNKGTKAIQFIEDKTKQYRGVMSFGTATSTQDGDGEVIGFSPVTLPLDQARLQAIVSSMIGKQLQLPPMVSAIKINGKKLYEYAREGIEVERTPREIELFRFDIEAIEGNEVSFVVDCSAGTYVRTLCVDVGEAYGVLAHMKSLVRTRVGSFTIDQCATLEDIRNGKYQIIPIMDALRTYPVQECVNVDDVKNGKPLYMDRQEPFVLMTHQNEAVAMYEMAEEGIYRCARGLW